MTHYQTRRCERCGAFFDVPVAEPARIPACRVTGPWSCAVCRTAPEAPLRPFRPVRFYNIVDRRIMGRMKAS